METYYEFDIWHPSMAARVTLVTVCGVMTAVGIMGNLLIIALVILVKNLRTTVNKGLAVLSLSDLIYLTYQPIITMNWEFGKDDSALGEHLCYLVLFYEKGGFLCSTLIFLFLSLDRYIAICHPLTSLYSGRRSVYILLAVGAASVVLSFPTYLMSHYDTFPEGNETYTFCYIGVMEPWMKGYSTALEIMSSFGTIPIIVYFYGRMIRTILKKRPTEEISHPKNAQARSASRTRTVVMLLIAVVVFVVCRFPRCMLELFNMYNREIFNVEEALVDRGSYIVYWISWILLFVNCQANPFIVFSMSTAFQKAFVDIFCKCRRAPKSKRAAFPVAISTVSSRLASSPRSDTDSSMVP